MAESGRTRGLLDTSVVIDLERIDSAALPDEVAVAELVVDVGHREVRGISVATSLQPHHREPGVRSLFRATRLHPWMASRRPSPPARAARGRR